MTTETTDVANEIFARLDSIGSKVVSTAPMIWEKMVVLTQFESIAYLISGAVCLVLAIICAFAAFRSAKKYDERENPGYNDAPLGFMAFGFGTFIFAIPGLINLLYIWNWVGAFSPESRLIARLIGAVTQTSVD
jgi:putative flippase GtrA